MASGDGKALKHSRPRAKRTKLFPRPGAPAKWWGMGCGYSRRRTRSGIAGVSRRLRPTETAGTRLPLVLARSIRLCFSPARPSVDIGMEIGRLPQARGEFRDRRTLQMRSTRQRDSFWKSYHLQVGGWRVVMTAKGGSGTRIELQPSRARKADPSLRSG